MSKGRTGITGRIGRTGRTGITDDYTTLLRQAPMTINSYFYDSIDIIDRKFGDGYSKEHPELLAALISGCVQDYNTAAMAKNIGEALYEIGEALANIALYKDR